MFRAPASLLPAPSPYTEQTRGLTERREPVSHPASPVRACRTGRCVPRPHPPPVPGTHAMALRPSSVPLRVPLPPPPESSFPAFPDLESDLGRAASPTASRLLTTVVTDPFFESTAASALVAELVDFAAVCRLNYATALVAESESSNPPSIGGECALGTDVLEDTQEEFECLAATVPRLASMSLAPEGDPDAPDIPAPRSFAEAITGTQWSLRRPVYGLRQADCKWQDTLRTTLAALGYTPSTADPSLLLRTDTSLPPFYILVYNDDLFLQITRDKELCTITLTQSRMVHQVLQRFGFQFSSPQPTPLSTGHSLSAPPSDESVEPSGPYPELVGCSARQGEGGGGEVRCFWRWRWQVALVPVLALAAGVGAGAGAGRRRWRWQKALVPLPALALATLASAGAPPSLLCAALPAPPARAPAALPTLPARAPAALPAPPARAPADARCPLLSALPYTLHCRMLPCTALHAALLLAAAAYTRSAEPPSRAALPSSPAKPPPSLVLPLPRAPMPFCTSPAFTATNAAGTAAMATPTVLTFDAEAHLIDFESWLEDLHWYLQSCNREDVSFFEHTSGSLDALAASADRVDCHLPLDQRTHFRLLKMAKALYDAVFKRYTSPSSATVGRLALPFLFLELSDFTTVIELLTHLLSFVTRYRAALEPAFLAENKPPIYLTLYFLTTRLSYSLHAICDQFLALDPTKITLASFESRLLEAESTALAVAASRKTSLPSVFEGCSPSLLAPSIAYAAAVDFLCAEERLLRSGKGKSGKGEGGVGGGGGGGSGGGGGGGSGGRGGGGGSSEGGGGGGSSEGGGGGGGGTRGGAGEGGAGGSTTRTAASGGVAGGGGGSGGGQH
ncbi:unnamed protein product [Closterium sp. NIES-54]